MLPFTGPESCSSPRPNFWWRYVCLPLRCVSSNISVYPPLCQRRNSPTDGAAIHVLQSHAPPPAKNNYHYCPPQRDPPTQNKGQRSARITTSNPDICQQIVLIVSLVPGGKRASRRMRRFSSSINCHFNPQYHAIAEIYILASLETPFTFTPMHSPHFSALTTSLRSHQCPAADTHVTSRHRSHSFLTGGSNHGRSIKV